jgi:predicted ATPase
MFLKTAQVKLYKCVIDSGPVEFDNQVTCLVGKNESGKTAFLEALYRLNPLPTGHPETFDGLRDYPRRTYNRDREAVPATIPIEATFLLEPDDIAAVENAYGKGVLSSHEVIIRKDYTNLQTWNLELDEQRLLEHLVKEAGLDACILEKVGTLADAVDKLQCLPSPPEGVSSLLNQLKETNYKDKVKEILASRLPKFLYFDEYNIMPGRVSIPKLQEASANTLQPGERTALSLLRLAGVQSQEFTQTNYEARKASLEAAANQVTDEVFEFWSQNKDLSIELDVDFNSAADQYGQPPFLDIRVRNHRHRVTLNFGERSHGFMWFFSFLAAFSEYRGKQRMILLLDEPGLGLHAAAQGDLLRFIDERLATDHQVVYTTHSPFIVDAKRLHRVRTVEDRDEDGTRITSDVLSTSKDTRFPLQAALGYELAQTLFLGPHNLVVEGPADYLYLQLMSAYLQGIGRTGLDPRWVIVPVGGLDKIPTFVALLGAQLDVAVLLEVVGGGTEKVNSLVQRGIIAGEKLIPLTEFTHTNEADIEDLFDESFYLLLLSRSGIASLEPGELNGTGRLLKRIEMRIGKFDHYRPARYLLEHQIELLSQVDPLTLDRFEQLFMRLNALLE